MNEYNSHAHLVSVIHLWSVINLLKTPEDRKSNKVENVKAVVDLTWLIIKQLWNRLRQLFISDNRLKLRAEFWSTNLLSNVVFYLNSGLLPFYFPQFEFIACLWTTTLCKRCCSIWKHVLEIKCRLQSWLYCQMAHEITFWLIMQP